jgi:ribulose-5-phosphate 4-epimerase/fuculose-1-phosphate aldolase
MNKPTRPTDVKAAEVSTEEWAARVDLAAVYRLLAHYGWDDVIYNHSSMRVPDEPRMFLMKRHELLYTEVTASNLVKVNMDQDLDEKSGVNRPGFTLHGGVLQARDDVNCAVHVHTNNGMAIGALPHGLRMVSQQAIRFYQRIGYHKYEGITEDFAERERINKDLGKNRAMILNHHGLLTVGKTARESFVLMKALIDAIDIQLKLECVNSEAVEIPAAICAKTAEQYAHHDSGRGSADWSAYLRALDKIDTSYRN